MSESPTANDPMAELLALLNLSEADGAQTDEDIFVGLALPNTVLPRLFGGQVLAQSLLAAIHTVAPDRPIHSMHGYFLRPGDVKLPVTFGVQRLRDGRSFSARRTHAYQNGQPILSLIASFQTPDSGIEHQMTMPSVPDPESLPTASQVLHGINHPATHAWADDRPFDIRHVEGSIYFSVDGDHVEHQAVWVKTVGPMPENQNLHRAALAYVSDYTLLEPSLRRHGLSWVTPGLKVASLDHAMWWHRPVKVDEWLLYVSESPSASGARGLNTGRFFDRAGNLVASVAQEGMIRVPEDDLP